MPCGGIHFYADLPSSQCFYCGKKDADHYVEEWDAMIHANCVLPFLNGDDGKLVLAHKHEVHIVFDPSERRRQKREYAKTAKRESQRRKDREKVQEVA